MDLNGFTANVTAAKIYTYDASATTAAAVPVSGVDTIWCKKEESLKLVGVPGFFLELLARFELTTVLPRSMLRGSPKRPRDFNLRFAHRMRSPVLL